MTEPATDYTGDSVTVSCSIDTDTGRRFVDVNYSPFGDSISLSPPAARLLAEQLHGNAARLEGALLPLAGGAA